jgi:hypothetical protein
MGASLGVTACAAIAREPDVVGLVFIAGPNNGGSLAEVSSPKLFVAGELDRWAVDTQLAYEQAAEPRQLVLFPGNSAHGTDLFYSADQEPFLELLLGFVNALPDA